MAITFTDYKNYPHGFRRSGDYSIKDSERLERFGHLFQQLLTGAKKPENPAEKAYLAQLSGKAEASPEVQAWNKYQKKISESKQYFPLCSTPTDEAEISVKKVAGVDGGDDADIDVDVGDPLEDDDDDMEIEET